MKFKKLISLLAATAMTLTAITGAMTASASEVANGTCGDGITWTLDSDGVLTLSGKGEMASPKVENTVTNDHQYSGFTVESQLGDYSDIFTYKKYSESIKEVVIEEGVTSIGFCAFYKMPNLETVVLPSSIKDFKGVGYQTYSGTNSGTDIGSYASYAFAECTSLKNLTLSDGMTVIGDYAFYNCTSLISVTIPKTITKWGAFSFFRCSNLKDITLTEGLTIIGGFVFCETAVESVVIPSTIKKWSRDTNRCLEDEIYDNIGKEFAYNTNLAFANCKKLSSVTFTDGLEIIQDSPFYGCSSLKKVTIPKSITDMIQSFENCTNLEEVYIEDGAQIPLKTSKSSNLAKAFRNCTNLRKIEIPEDVVVSWTGSNWDSGCSSITDIYFHSMENGLPYSIIDNTSIKIHCNYGSKLHQSTSITDDRKITFEEEIPEILKNLNTAIEEAEKYAEADYTTESYGVLKTALENAKKYDENYTGVMVMQWAAEDISNAINSLVKKPAQDSVKPGTTKPSTDNKITYTKSQAQKNAENAMKQAKITKLTVKSKAKKKITVTWKKVSMANGYQVQVSTNKKFKKSKIILTKTTSKKKITIKKLKSKKTYFVRVRAYATYKDSNGKPQKVYSSWIKKTRKVKIK